jgi:hypothetical protein
MPKMLPRLKRSKKLRDDILDGAGDIPLSDIEPPVTDRSLVPSEAPDKNGQTLEDHARQTRPDPNVYMSNLSSWGKGDILSVKRLVNRNGVDVPELCLVATLVKHATVMFCLPLHSFGQQGLNGIDWQMRNDYIGIRNRGSPPEEDFNQGVQYIEVQCLGRKPLHPATVIHLSRSIEVSYPSDVVKVGRLPGPELEVLKQAWVNNFVTADRNDLAG